MLAKQKAMMRDRRAQLDTIIEAIERTQARLEAGDYDWAAIAHITEVIQMEQKKDWVNKHFTPEQLATMQGLSDQAYSDEAKAKLAS